MTDNQDHAPGEHDAQTGERLHVSGLLVGFVTGLPQLAVPVLAGVFGVRSANNPVLIPFVIAAALLLSLFVRWVAWMRFRYFIGMHDIRIEKGIVNRTARSIPYERIQDVSVEQRPLARMLGLGEVKFETGGGEGDDAKLSFVAIEEAERLRELVRARKGGAVTDVVPQEPGEISVAAPIFVMDTVRVLTLGLYSFSLVIFAILGGAAQQLDFLLPFDLWDIGAWIGIAEDRGVDIDQINGISVAARVIFATIALAMLLFVGFASGVIRTTLKEHGFRLDRTEKGFRRRRGLLTLTDVVMPAHRVQAAVIETGPVRKRRGWYALKFVSLAQDSKEESNYVAAPFAKLSEIWPIAEAAHIIGPTSDTQMRRGDRRHWTIRIWLIAPVLLGVVGAAAFLPEVAMFRVLAPLLVAIPLALLFWLDWKHYSYAIGDEQIYLRRGWWLQKLLIAPHVKVQTAEICRGPISRRLGLATLKLGISGGTMEMVALPLSTAQAIRDAVMEKVVEVDYSVVNRER
ncbi:MAG: PH domain-containing protein [Sphingorhabdus sp.]